MPFASNIYHFFIGKNFLDPFLIPCLWHVRYIMSSNNYSLPYYTLYSILWLKPSPKINLVYKNSRSSKFCIQQERYQNKARLFGGGCAFIFILYVWMYVCAAQWSALPGEARWWRFLTWGWSYRKLCAAMWVLGIKHSPLEEQLSHLSSP